MKLKRNTNIEKLQNEIMTKFGKTKKGASKLLKSRKERRRQIRLDKKAKKIAYFSKNVKISPPAVDTDSEKVSVPNKDNHEQKSAQSKVLKRSRKNIYEPINQAENEFTKKQTSSSSSGVSVFEREHIELQRLERQLNLTKGKPLPKAFISDGLNYILDALDKDNLKHVSDSEFEMPVEDEVDDDTCAVNLKGGSKKGTLTHSTRKDKIVRFANEVIEKKEQNHQVGDEVDNSVVTLYSTGLKKKYKASDSRFFQETDHCSKKREIFKEKLEDDDTEKTVETSRNIVCEDIYGRLVDGHGKIMSTAASDKGGTYIPPGKRATLFTETNKSLPPERLKKQIKGLLNRVTESNMQGIAGSIEELYMNHSRADVNDTLFTVIMELCVTDTLLPDSFISQIVMMVAILHGNVGSEVGAFFLQHLVKRFDEMFVQKQYEDGHSINNILLLLAYLYNFKICHHILMFDVLHCLVESFTEKDVELILLLLKVCGFSMRRDDPEALGHVITIIQKKARELDKSKKETFSHVHFMLEMLIAIRNNNVHRVSSIDYDHLDRMCRLASTCIRGGSLSDNQLNVSLKDLLKAEEAGHWWLLGSGWRGNIAIDASDDKGSRNGAPMSVTSGAVSKKLIDLARAQHMNSDVRRSIFFALMTSEDYQDAFQKVLQLGIKRHQEREIVVVAVECCKNESTYNPFYSFFLARLAQQDRRFMMMIQFHMWDIFKEVCGMPRSNRNNIALMLAHLLGCQALPLSLLKVLEFGTLNENVVDFLRIMLSHLLTANPASDIEVIFKRVGQQIKIRHLGEGLRLFCNHFLLTKKLNVNRKLLKLNIALASRALSAQSETVL